MPITIPIWAVWVFGAGIYLLVAGFVFSIYPKNKAHFGRTATRTEAPFVAGLWPTIPVLIAIILPILIGNKIGQRFRTQLTDKDDGLE